ncbi:MAG: phospholipase A [Sulfurimonas sp.]|uniref:phospholipase A n=1 Tax=Sulfurimonas sp. TaxID=2022749 RepID=UPI0025FD7451|nr:phospholipase A [Sulfurimonas sp.]MCK9491055.1 phospholipase A [Sulfurimonas sp.]
MKYILVLVFLVLSLMAAERKYKEIESYDITNIEDEISKKSMRKWLDEDFGLKPHRANYLLPYGYRNGDYKSYVPTDEYRNTEAELQVSIKLYLGTNLLGFDESYYLAYSHLAFWQIFAESSPFRETNYTPEAFVDFPVIKRETYFNMRSLRLGIAHTSNGQGSNKGVTYADPSQNPGNRSRNVNLIYTELSFQHDTLLTELKFYAPLPGTANDEDNPDIMDYLGYTSIKFNYFLGHHMFTLMARGNFATGYGAVESTYSYPLIDDAYFYTKIFSGYGESLIDYNNDITKFSIGFSFSR